jgi:hypothetical protein
MEWGNVAEWATAAVALFAALVALLQIRRLRTDRADERDHQREVFARRVWFKALVTMHDEFGRKWVDVELTVHNNSPDPITPVSLVVALGQVAADGAIASIVDGTRFQHGLRPLMGGGVELGFGLGFLGPGDSSEVEITLPEGATLERTDLWWVDAWDAACHRRTSADARTFERPANVPDFEALFNDKSTCDPDQRWAEPPRTTRRSPTSRRPSAPVCQPPSGMPQPSNIATSRPTARGRR